MESLDRHVLRVLAAADGHPLSVDVIASETGRDVATVDVRCGDLVQRDLLGRAGPDAYYVRDAGRQYVESDAPEVDPLPAGVEAVPSWMERGDVHILAAIDERATPVARADVASACGVFESYVERRCERLAAEGLVQPVGADAYELRDAGAAFLAGDIDPDVLDAP
jgi:DNA-binding IclR family transcriptional regulator